jgi:hypothetical protein
MVQVATIITPTKSARLYTMLPWVSRIVRIIDYHFQDAKSIYKDQKLVSYSSINGFYFTTHRQPSHTSKRSTILASLQKPSKNQSSNMKASVLISAALSILISSVAALPAPAANSVVSRNPGVDVLRNLNKKPLRKCLVRSRIYQGL